MMRIRTAILVAIFALAAVGLLTVACIVTIPNGPAIQTTRQPLDLPAWPTGTPEPPSRGFGPLVLTATAPNAVCDTGVNEFSAGYLRCFNPEADIIYSAPCGLGTIGVGSTSSPSVALISPDINMTINRIEMFVAGSEGLEVAQHWLEVYVAPSLPYTLEVQIAQSISVTLPTLGEDGANFFRYEPATAFTFTTPIVLEMGTQYVVLVTTDNESENSNVGFSSNANFGCNTEPTYPSWVYTTTFSLCDGTAGKACSYGCSRDTVGEDWYCSTRTSWVPPVALYGTETAPTPTPVPAPTATPFCTIPTPVPITTINVSLPGEFYLPLYDTFICATEPDANFGNNSTASLNSDCSLLLEWPTLAGAFQGRTVTQAKLRLFVVGQPTPELGSSVFFVSPTMPNWNELAATWNRRATGTNWTIAGARGAGTDYDYPPQGYMSVNGSSAGWVDIDINGSLINNWVNNPASNQGLIIWSSTAENDLRIATSEWFSFGYRPQLVLTFQ